MAVPGKRFSFIILSLILVLACVIRIKGIWFGYPLPVHPDEPKLVETALNMIKSGDFNPHFFNYPSLNIYLLDLVYKAAILGFEHFSHLTMENIPKIWFYLIGRAFTVFLSVSTIVVVYAIGRRLFSSYHGLMAACFVAASFLHIVNSFTVTVDSSVALWISLATLSAVLIFTEGKRYRYYVLAGACVGLAISCKYIAFVSVLPVLIAHLRVSRNRGEILDRYILSSLLVIPISFVATTPYSVLDYHAFFQAIDYEGRHYSVGHPGFEAAESRSFMMYVRYLIGTGYGYVPTLFAAIGGVCLRRKDVWKGALLLATPVVLVVLVGRFRVFFPRNVVAVVPFLALFSGYFLALLYEWWEERFVGAVDGRRIVIFGSVALFAGITVGSIIPNVLTSLDYIRQVTLPDTRWVSLLWIRDNVPVGSNIGREFYTPPVEEYSEDFRVSCLGYFAVVRKPREVMKQDFMILSSGDYGRFLEAEEMYPREAESYLEFFREHQLVKEFSADRLSLNGPKISVYKIRRTTNDGE
ncbi:ArnT family glycosyltransferase [Petrachloros mirabilis]